MSLDVALLCRFGTQPPSAFQWATVSRDIKWVHQSAAMADSSGPLVIAEEFSEGHLLDDTGPSRDWCSGIKVAVLSCANGQGGLLTQCKLTGRFSSAERRLPDAEERLLERYATVAKLITLDCRARLVDFNIGMGLC